MDFLAAVLFAVRLGQWLTFLLVGDQRLAFKYHPAIAAFDYMYATHKEAEADQQQREQSMLRTKKVEVGQLVLLRKPFYERGVG